MQADGGQTNEQAVEQAAKLLRARQRGVKRRLRLGLFTALRMYVQGRRDGRRGLPSQSERDVYTSPFIAREIEEHRQFCATSRLHCDQKTARLRQWAARLEKEQALLESTIDEVESSLERRRAEFDPDAQTPRNTGEQKLDATLLCNRRQAEFEKSLAPLNGHIDSARTTLKAKRLEHAVILAGIEQEERLSRGDCERHERRTERKITAYWQAALTTYRAVKPRGRLPLRPPSTLFQPPSDTQSDARTTAWLDARADTRLEARADARLDTRPQSTAGA
jgi:hypothetical protein